jgi:hypothetical protein
MVHMNPVRLDLPGGCGALSDDELVAAFEDATLESDLFRHADHVRLAWIYLRRMPLLDAIGVYRNGLRRFAAANGAPERYHETITWAFMVLVNERLHGCADDVAWPEFAAANGDLLRWRGGAFFDSYEADVLGSETARRIFVLPRPGRRRDARPASETAR